MLWQMARSPLLGLNNGCVDRYLAWVDGCLISFFKNLLWHQQTLRYFLICGNVAVNIQTFVTLFMSVVTCSEHPDLCDIIHVCGNVVRSSQFFI